MKSRYVIFLLALLLYSPTIYLMNQNSEDITLAHLDRGSTIATTYANDIAETVYHQASEELFLQIIKDLTSFGPRPYQSPTNEIAKEWLISKLNNVSDYKLEIETPGFTDSIVARLPGTLNNSICFMVGGHYDTVEEAPGANDDGTGVAQ